MSEPQYAERQSESIFDPYVEQLRQWVQADMHRAKRDRRTAKAMFEAIKAQGFTGSYVLLAVHVRKLQAEIKDAPLRKAFVPLAFAHGEAFQFDWSCEYAWIGGLRRRLEVAHCKLASSRAFWLVAYYTQSHEMLFDAHTRSFEAFGGIPRRGIYDNMKTAVDKVHKGKKRNVNARFEAMCGRYLFEPDFCNVASGWEKGIVEKNVQDRRRQIWLEANTKRWTSLAKLNIWLAERCRNAWDTLRHPQWQIMTVGEVLQDERLQLMPMPKPFDGYVEQPVRASSCTSIQICWYWWPMAGKLPSMIACFERCQTIYNWQHYIPVISQKPGALRNGAPFATMPEALQSLQRHLLKHPGGDRVMAQVLSVIPIHGLEAVLVVVEIALEFGRPSGEHVLNALGRLKGPPPQENILSIPLVLQEEPEANVSRYEQLRSSSEIDNVK